MKMIGFRQFVMMVSIFLFANPLYSQTTLVWGTDIAPVQFGTHLTVNFEDKFRLGIEGEIGINFSHYLIAGGSHFASGSTLIKYEQRDEYGNERYFSIAGYAIFTRILNKTKFPIDVGYRHEFFAHVDDSDDDVGSGNFRGVYAKIFWPSKYKMKDDKRKRRAAVGLRLTVGGLKESSSINEWGVAIDFSVRMFFNYSKIKA
jgi:hypothetical protein